MTNKPRYHYPSDATRLNMSRAGIDLHPGYTGAFTRATADGAIPSGERVQKILSEKGDAHPNGSLGTVLGSFTIPKRGIVYWIEWDALPHHAVFTVSSKIGRLEDGKT